MRITATHQHTGKIVWFENGKFGGNLRLVGEALNAVNLSRTVEIPGVGNVVASTQPDGAWAALWFACRGQALVDRPFPSVSQVA